jgi:NOL1/NOP2/fmu family ribosome biogenesis protein
MPHVAWCDDGIYLPERPVFTLDPLYHAGAYYVQEASSMFLQQMLSQAINGRTRLRVLDLCAAPGGKSTLTAAALDSDSLLVSNEVIRTRASILEENISRWGYMNTWVTCNDPRDFGKLSGYFDIIIVDAPCSGSGLWRKDHAALNEWSEGNVQLCAARQQRILADVWPALKAGGTLIYATCSYSPQEDEDILDWMADTYNITSHRTTLNDTWGIAETVSRRQMHGYRFFPGKVQGEGFFIASIVKNENEGSIKTSTGKPMRDKKIQEAASHFFHREVALMPGRDGAYNAINPLHEADMHILQKAVYLRKTGVEAGTPTAKEWIPAHDIALNIDASPMLPSLEVARADALRFLKREDMGIAQPAKGWYLIRYQGLGLGWIKALGNRSNNYLPKQWRIRMDIEEA